MGATWSPDGRYVAYSSDRGGKFDVWVQQVSGGDPVQVTKRPGHNWQPDWSPDVYFVSGRGGFFNVWGIHFDPAGGKPVGEPFRVSAFEGPGLMIPKWIPPVELSLN